MTEAERERLAYLAEEASELVKACMKCLRHGFETKRRDYRRALEAELGHTQAALDLCVRGGDVDKARVKMFQQQKGAKKKRFHHQDDLLARGVQFVADEQVGA